MCCKKRREADQGGRAMKKRSQAVNWVNMPADIMLLIFMKLGVDEILLNAQNVCSYWRKLAKDPILYRVIDFQGCMGSEEYSHNYKYQKHQLVRLAKEALDRSCGQLVRFSSIAGFGWDVILNYVNYTNSPKSVHLRKGTIMTEIQLAHVVKGLDSVEELGISFGNFPTDVIEEAGRVCHKLTNFRLSIWDTMGGKDSDKAVLTIVSNMPQLRRLSLEGFLFTNKGLRTILDGCPHMEHLDLRQCSGNQALKKTFVKRRATKIRNVIPPSRYVLERKDYGARAWPNARGRIR